MQRIDHCSLQATIIFESSFSIQKSIKELMQKGLEKIIVHTILQFLWWFFTFMDHVFVKYTFVFVKTIYNWLENWRQFRIMNLCKHVVCKCDVRSIYKGGVKINHLISHEIWEKKHFFNHKDCNFDCTKNFTIYFT